MPSEPTAQSSSNLSKKQVVVLCTVVAAVILCLYTQDWTSGFFFPGTTPIQKVDIKENSSYVPLVLTWTPYYSVNFAKYLEDGLQNCSYRCNFTDDKSTLNETDAVAFHIRNVNVSDLPRVRHDNQYYVFFLLESPHHTGGALAEYYNGFSGKSSGNAIPNDYFNVTMTYRRDGDILAGYGKLEKKDVIRPDSITWNYTDIERSFVGRPKAVLQFVSHCGTPSQREVYVDELSKYIDVMRVGQCGIKNCSKECEKKAIAEHNFYLSFENSVCRDYITEKLYNWLGKMLPIVLKRSLYKGIVPDEAFIATDDFNSPKDLANYLHYLLNNRTAFMKYFEWTKSYQSVQLNIGCAFCTYLHQKANSPAVVSNIRRWWYREAKCQPNFVTKMFAQRAPEALKAPKVKLKK